MEGVVDRADGSAVIQKDFNGLEKLDLLNVCAKAGWVAERKVRNRKSPKIRGKGGVLLQSS